MERVPTSPAFSSMAVLLRKALYTLAFLALAANGSAEPAPHPPIQTEEGGVRHLAWPRQERTLWAMAGVTVLARLALLHRRRTDGK